MTDWKATLDTQDERFTKAWFLQHPITKELLNSDIVTGKVLDLGCGIGGRTYAAATKFPTAKLVGLDTSEFAIEHARNSFNIPNNTEFVVGSVLELPFGYKTFDNAFMLAVIEHVKETDLLLKEIVRVTSGKLFLSVTENDYHWDANHVHQYSCKSLEMIIRQYFYIEVIYVKEHIIFVRGTVK